MMKNSSNLVDANDLIDIMIGILQDMNVDFDQFTVDHFISRLGAFTSWKIQLIYAPLQRVLGEKIDGFWVRNPVRRLHYIFVDSSIPLPRQHNTIFHESGHILQKHPTLAISNLAKLDLGAVLMRKRDEAYKQHEFEAELFSYVLQSFIYHPVSRRDGKNIYHLVHTGDQ